MKSKTIGIIFLILWTICCIVNVIKNMGHYKIGDWIVILIVIAIPYIVYFAVKNKKQPNKSPKEKTVLKSFNDITPAQIREPINSTYIHTDNTIIRADGKPISNEEVPYLMEISLMKTSESEKNKPKLSIEDDELVFQFMTKYGVESQNYCNLFEKLSREAYNEPNLNKKIKLLEEAVITFERVKQWHYNHSKGAKLYFYQFWECMHNSKNTNFCWVDSVKDELTFQIMKRDTIIPWILDNSHTGFLQTEIYKAFPKMDAVLLRKTIDETVISFNLSKTKKGGTYFIKETQVFKT